MAEKIGSFTVPGLTFNDEPEIPATEVVEQVEAAPEPPAPMEPAAPEPVVAEPAAVPEPPVQAEPEPPAQQFEDIFKQRLGMDISAVEAALKEVEALKQRPTLEDPELLADDDFLKGLVLTYKRGGNVLDYVEYNRTDFSKMSPEEIVKYDLRKTYKDAPESVISRKYRDHMASLGWTDDLEEGSPEKKEFMEALNWNAGQLREKLMEQGKKFAIPERKPQEPVQQDSAKLEAEAQAYLDQLVKSAPVTEMTAQKSVKYGDFQFSVDPTEVVSMLMDNTKLFSNFINPDGTQNTAKLLKWVALAQDPEKVINAAVAERVAKERIKILEEMKNPSPPEPVAPPAAPTGISVKWLSRN